MRTTAIVLNNPGEVSLQTFDLPEPTRRDVVVELEASGISAGTERWAYLGKRAELSFPNVPGYMGIGRVVDAGGAARAAGYTEGDRVNFFQSRLPDPYTGSWMGSHLSHAVVDAVEEQEQANPEQLDVHRCVKLPEGLDSTHAALTGLCAVAMRGIEMAVVPAGARVLVSGVGVVGQFAAQVCRLKGAQVAVSDVVPSRLEVAMRCGAELAVNPKRQPLDEATYAFAPKGFDIIIDTSSQPAVVNALFPLLRLHGKFVFQGWYPPPSSLDLNAAHARMPTCFFPCAHSGTAVATAMRLAAEGHLQIGPLITHRANPRDAPMVYRMLAENPADSLGVVFDWSQL